MNYECTLMSVDKLMHDPMGFKDSLCTDCQAPDCTNPIREKTVSIMGIPHIMRLYVVNNIVKQVVSCAGYIGQANASLPSIEKSFQEPTAPITSSNKQSESYYSTLKDSKDKSI